MAHQAFAALLLAVACALLADVARGCVYKYGEDPLHPLTKPDDSHFTYEFAGLDWKGVCESGRKQSPINIPNKVFEPIPAAARTIPDFGQITSTGKNIKIFNNQHVVQVEWVDAELKSSASVAVPNQQGMLSDTLGAGDKTHRAAITPLQFHFHAHSEHSLSGAFYPLELHIVNQAKSDVLAGCNGPLGCLAVVGVMFGLSDDDTDSPLLEDIFDAMPLAGDKNYTYFPAGKVLDLNALIPSNKSYVTYDGSLTTPPCSENVLWHVMLEPMTMSARQLKQFLAATGDIKCSHTSSTSEIKPAAATNSTGSVAGVGPQCTRLGAGQNYRIVQSMLGRTVKAYIEAPAAGSSGTTAAASTVTRSASFAFQAARFSSWVLGAVLLLAMAWL